MFQYYLPVNLIFGRGRINDIGKISGDIGRKALLVTGKSSTKKTGVLDLVIGHLKKAKMEVCVFDQVESNPLTTTAERGANICQEQQCDMVIGLGGGSVLDCAKAIAFLAINKGDINDYIYMKKTGTMALPLLLVPTTCGTGSEGNAFAVLTNPENGDKKSLRSNAIIAKVAIVDSTLMETMPKGIVASVGFDALCHAMEAYLSKISQPFSDMMAIESMKLINMHLKKVYQGAGTEEDWNAITLASTLGGMSIGIAGVTLPHAMEHPASGLKDIVHGQGLAALTPVITGESIRKASANSNSYSNTLEKYRKISRCLGGTNEDDCEEQIREILTFLNLDITLKQLDIENEDIAWMGENCIRVSMAGIKNHPVQFSKEEIITLYQKSCGI